MKKEKPVQFAEFTVLKFYLMMYNLMQLFGWLLILSQTSEQVLSKGVGKHRMWKATFDYLRPFQLLAILEVFHAFFGLVKSNTLTTAVQLFSRVFIVLPICSPFRDAQISLGYTLLLTAWSLTEAVRYSFYLFNIFNMAPRVLTYLRYNLFIILYPMGVLGEQLCIFAALPEIAKTNFLSLSLPNKFNVTFNFYYFCIAFMLLYIPIFPQLYMHMFSQRRKVLGAVAKEKLKIS